MVLTDDGSCGTGEAWCFDTRPDALAVFLETEVIDHFLGVELCHVHQIARALIDKAALMARHGILASALSSFDIAMHDLLGQDAGVPIWRRLAPKGPGKARLYASGGLYGEAKSVTSLVAEMADFANEGFGLSKMKVGALPLEQGVERVEAVLSALPGEEKLIVAAVYCYSTEDALKFFSALPRDRIEACQSPTKAWDIDGLSRLQANGVPVMVTEAEYRSELHRVLVHDVGVSFLQIAPIAVGGISRVMELADLVETTGTGLSLEVSSKAVAMMAAIHAAAARPEIAHVEFHFIHTVFFDMPRLDAMDGDRNWVTPPETPGLWLSLPLGILRPWA